MSELLIYYFMKNPIMYKKNYLLKDSYYFLIKQFKLIKFL